VTGAILRWGGDDPDAANVVWALTTVTGIFPIGWEVLTGLLRSSWLAADAEEKERVAAG
jgi:hypothetical protein